MPDSWLTISCNDDSPFCIIKILLAHPTRLHRHRTSTSLTAQPKRVLYARIREQNFQNVCENIWAGNERVETRLYTDAAGVRCYRATYAKKLQVREAPMFCARLGSQSSGFCCLITSARIFEGIKTGKGS